MIRPEGPIRVLLDWLGQRIAVKGLETFDSAGGLKYLEVTYHTVPVGYLETTHSGYIEEMASMVGVMHATTPTTPGIRTRQRVFRAIVGKAQWILRARPDVLYAAEELSREAAGTTRGRQCGSQEVGEVPLWHA